MDSNSHDGISNFLEVAVQIVQAIRGSRQLITNARAAAKSALLRWQHCILRCHALFFTPLHLAFISSVACRAQLYPGPTQYNILLKNILNSLVHNPHAFLNQQSSSATCRTSVASGIECIHCPAAAPGNRHRSVHTKQPPPQTPTPRRATQTLGRAERTMSESDWQKFRLSCHATNLELPKKICIH